MATWLIRTAGVGNMTHDEIRLAEAAMRRSLSGFVFYGAISLDDVIQSAWASVFSAFPRMSETGPPEHGYFVVAARCTALRMKAREKRRSLARLTYDPPATLPPESDSGSPQMLLGLVTEAQARAIDLALGLGGAEPRSAAEVANILGISRRKVRDRFADGIESLRKRFPMPDKPERHVSYDWHSTSRSCA